MKEEKIFKIIIYSILISGAIIPFISYFLMGVLICLVFVFRREKDVIDCWRDNKIILALILTTTVSTFFSELWYISVFYLIVFILKILYSTTVLLYINRDDIKNILLILVLTGVIVSVIGILQVIYNHNTMPDWWIDKEVFTINFRVYSTFYNPNILAVFLNLVIICGIIVIEVLKNKDKALYYLSFASIILSLVCLILTYSRSGWISLCIAILTLSFIDSKFFRYFLFFTFLFISIDFISGIGRLDIHKLTIDSSIHYRYEIWLSSIKIIKDNLLFGIGPGIVWDFIPRYSNLIKAYVSHSHNLYLQLLLDTGLIGITVVIYFIIQIFSGIRASFKSQGFVKVISFISFTFYISLLVHGFIDAVSLQAQISIYLSCLIGINYKIKEIELKKAIA
jgi:O-antigen ligase